MSNFNSIINSSQPVLVDFFATWCGPCKQLSPVLENTAKTLGDRVKIIKVDVDKNPGAASAYQVRGVPTMILFQNGKIKWRASGYMNERQLLDQINQALKN